MRRGIILYSVFILSSVWAAPSSKVNSQSGPNDEKVEEKYDEEKIDKKQKQEDSIESGPYDPQGNYRYIPEIREDKTPQD